MNISNFSDISENYEKTSLVQKAAGEALFDLLKIKDFEDVLDLGCGPGHLTFRISSLTKGKVVGIDPSIGMIQKANEKYHSQNIIFEIGSAENLHYEKVKNHPDTANTFSYFKASWIFLKNADEYSTLFKNAGIPINPEYQERFLELVERSFIEQSKNNLINLIFNRIFLLAKR